MQESSLKPLTLKITDKMLDTIGEQGVALGHSFFNGDVRICGLFGDPQMQLIGLAKSRLTEWGYSHDGLEDFLLYLAHENSDSPVADYLYDSSLWDRKDRLHSDFINKIIGFSDVTETAGITTTYTESKEAVYLKKWLHQTVALGLNDALPPHVSGFYGPYGAAGVLVFYGEKNITPLLKKITAGHYYSYEFLNERACINTSDQGSLHQALSTWITVLDDIYPEAKSFFLANQDTVRPFLARQDMLKPRRTSFCVNLTGQDRLANIKLLARLDQINGSVPVFWPICTDNIDMKRVKALDNEWAHQLWMQVYEELYTPNPRGYTLSSRPDQENSALKFFGTQMRWREEGREEDEEPTKRTVIYQAYLDWCKKTPKERSVVRIDMFFRDIIGHLMEMGFDKKDIETEDGLCLKEFTV